MKRQHLSGGTIFYSRAFFLGGVVTLLLCTVASLSGGVVVGGFGGSSSSSGSGSPVTTPVTTAPILTGFGTPPTSTVVTNSAVSVTPVVTGFGTSLVTTPTKQVPVTNSIVVTGFAQQQADAADYAFTTSLLKIQSSAFTLTTNIGTFLQDTYQLSSQGAEVSQGPVIIPGFSAASAAAAAQSSGQVVFTPPSFFGGLSYNINDTSAFATFKNFLNAPAPALSYMSLLTQMWQLYGTQISSLTDKNAQQSAAQEPFKQGSYLLSMYTQLVAQILSFLQIRLGTLSVTTYGMDGALYFLTSEVPALDATVAAVQTQFGQYLMGKSSDGYPNVSSFAGSNGTVYKNNYQAVSNNYTQQKGLLFTHFVLELFQSLSSAYGASACNTAITNLFGSPFLSKEAAQQFTCLQAYYAQALAGLQLLANQATVPAVGIYPTPQAAVNQLSDWLASLYLYAANVGQNNMTQQATSPQALLYQSQVQLNQTVTQDQAFFLTTLQATIAQTEQYYNKAGQAFSTELDVVRASTYAQMSSYLMYGLAYWKKGDAYVGANDFADASNAYQLAAQFFKKTGNVALSYMLLRRADTVIVAYYQLLLTSYGQYYQQIVPSFVSQMSSPPDGQITAQAAASWHTSYPQGFLQLFYYDADGQSSATAPLCQGMAWLAAQAVTSYASLLNTYQTDISASGVTTKAYLSGSLNSLESFIQAAQGMFYNDPLAGLTSIHTSALPTQEVAADANIGSSTVRGVVEGYLQYVKIYNLFKNVDVINALAPPSLNQGGQITQFPYQGLFQGLPLIGFADFSELGQLYWSLMNVDTCLALPETYPEYTQTVVSAAVLLLVYAQSLSTDPALQPVLVSGYTQWIAEKIKKVTALTYGPSALSPVQLLLKEGAALRTQANSALDYQAAAACFMAAGLLGSAQGQQGYFSTLDALAQWYVNSSGISFASFYAAATYYRAYLAQQAGWKAPATLATQFENCMTQFSQEMNKFLAQGYTTDIESAQKMVAFQEEINFMVVAQKREQLLFGGAAHDFLSTTSSPLIVTQTAQETTVQSLPQLTVRYLTSLSTLAVQEITFTEPQYNVAQLYYAQGENFFSQLQQAFLAGLYDVSFQNLYNQVENSYLQAVNIFTKNGYSGMVPEVQRAITQSAAFSYYTCVIPAASVGTLLKKYLSSTPTFSRSFFAALPQTQTAAPVVTTTGAIVLAGFGQTDSTIGQVPSDFSLVIPTGNEPTTGPNFQTVAAPDPTQSSLFPAFQPAYLLRYAQQDLTELAQEEAQLKTAAQAAAAAQKNAHALAQKSSAVGLPALPVQTNSYADLIVTASKLLGGARSVSSSTSDTTLVTELVVPLYRIFLVANAYSSPFSTLDQEVNRYSNQVIGLVKGGMLDGVSQTPLLTSYTLQKQLVNGVEHLMLVTSNGPLQAIPRMQNELQTALLYYTQYLQFFSVNPQTVQIGGQIFYQIADTDGSKTAQGFKGIVGAYLSQMSEYVAVVKNCLTMAPPSGSLQSLSTYSFSTYQSVYQLIGQAYSWVFSSISSLQQAQQNAGIYWVPSSSVNGMELQFYQQYMQACSRFLVGNPLSTAYKSVLRKIAGVANYALTYIQNAAQKQTVLQALGACYESAGDVASMSPQALPSINGFPSPAATTIPQAPLDLTASYTSGHCAYPAALGLQAPADYTLSWMQYIGGASYYLQAYTQYEAAYAANPSGNPSAIDSDPSTRRGLGKYITATMKAVVQRLALYGRNAVTFTCVLPQQQWAGEAYEGATTGETTPAATDSAKCTVSINPTFSGILQAGQSDGGQAALQGFSALSGGAAVSTGSGAMQAQYSAMKKLLLDSLIYCDSIQVATGKIADQYLSSATATKSYDVSDDMLGGSTVQCGLAYFLPGVQTLVAQQQSVGAAYEGGTVGENSIQDPLIETHVEIIPSYEVDLGKLGKVVLQELLYANTFPMFVDYCMSAVMGTADAPSPFDGLTQKTQVNALNDLVSQINTLAQSAYMWAFLPPTIANDPSQLSADISAAMKAEEQDMIVNPEAYVG